MIGAPGVLSWPPAVYARRQARHHWVISEEQGEDEECDPHEFMQLGTWTGDIKNPTVKMHG